MLHLRLDAVPSGCDTSSIDFVIEVDFLGVAGHLGNQWNVYVSRTSRLFLRLFIHLFRIACYQSLMTADAYLRVNLPLL